MCSNDTMSNVYGSINDAAAALDAEIDPYATTTTSVTLLSLTSNETPQNQTRDLEKTIKQKLPVDNANSELVFPFNSALFAAPLTYVTEAVLPATLSLSVTKAVGVQWSFSRTKPISAGCAFVLGDTKQLQDEATTDPKNKSTFTVNHIVPTGVVAESTYQVTVNRYAPGQTQLRVFTWSSLDTPENSFGHAVLSHDRNTGKYVGSFDATASTMRLVVTFQATTQAK
ncbi:hypothetical protein T492DRAFT_1133466 [Pavlovales sp. CCMP2436]|nr:hypothetical protein T492DRAFT_1133466 [Pavlovales sp. CCMP2436]